LLSSLDFMDGWNERVNACLYVVDSVIIISCTSSDDTTYTEEVYSMLVCLDADWEREWFGLL